MSGLSRRRPCAGPFPRATDADPQLGFQGELYPTYGFTDATGPFTAFPEDRNPVISIMPLRSPGSA